MRDRLAPFRIPLLLGLTALLCSCRPAAVTAQNANGLTDAEARAGWVSLFDGETTEGWRSYQTDSLGDGWEIVDGALCRTDGGAGDILYDQKFEWFELSIEYKIAPGGNSGIMFHVNEDNPRPWHSGPEIQVLDNERGGDGQKAGWLYQLYPSRVDATRPAGEWNHIYLRIAPDGCEIHVNGIRYSQFLIGSPEWNARVRESKFARYDDFGTVGSGYICLQDHGNPVCFRNIKVRELTPGEDVPNPVDGMLPLRTVPAFEDLEWADWSPVNDDGQPEPLRPIALTHAGDGSGRIFVATQRGVIHVFRPGDRETKVFLNIRDQVVYNDRMNEEGLLGLAFHPDYEENGEFYLYYTTADADHTSVVTRFRVSEDDPDRADPDSEEEILRVPQPFWNHNGGTICFGPDGYLYIALGDGGAANDPHNNGQNLNTWLGSILRIDVDRAEGDRADVDRAEGDRAYGIPTDNPFVDREGAQPEIWAYGLRNVWRMAFDPETGTMWAGDVGQNLWEEIDLIRAGGNYGWNLREASFPFGSRSVEADDLIAPIWEYDHQVGKSITGGLVYRGERLASVLDGAYLYADYVSGKIWALRYDEEAETVEGNYGIPADPFAVISFGEDQEGEVYFLIVAGDGNGIYTFEMNEGAVSTDSP